jgi:hypothetical protein
MDELNEYFSPAGARFTSEASNLDVPESSTLAILHGVLGCGVVGYCEASAATAAILLMQPGEGYLSSGSSASSNNRNQSWPCPARS